ncbi:flippase [uncultured Methanoculleus sp.]|jgi:O-antigen/teichoic acid export membrane protein|uniref:flippase n=1 Tax=uncultured Methanoculleus sp. TaxID=183762 RepID=UPI003204B382
MSYQRFAKDVAIIGITQVLTSLGGFILLPLITKTLGAYDYGIWAQISITISLLTPMALLGLSMALVRFLSAEKNIEHIREGLYSIIVFVLFTGSGISFLVFLLSDLLATSIFGDIATSPYIRAGSFLILLSALDQLALFYFRVSRQTKTFALLTIFQSFGQFFLVLALLLSGFGLMGVILATLIVNIALFVVAMVRVTAQVGFAIPRFTYLAEYLRYSLPLTPNSLIRWVTDSSDRYLIGFFLGVGSVGVYSAAYAIGNLIQLFISPIQFILFPELSRLYDERKSGDVKVYLSYSLKYFLFIAIPAAFGLAVLSKPLLEIFTSTEFVSGSSVIPFIALAGLLAGVFQVIINITHLVKKTQFNLAIHVVAAVINVILNVLLIPMIGILGAAIATTLSYLAMVIICISVSFKYIKFDLHGDFIIKSIVASGIMAGLVYPLYPQEIFSLLLVVTGGTIVYVLVMIVFFRSFNYQELNMLKNLVMKRL